MSMAYLIIKRMIDFIVALLGLVILSPLFLLLALLVALDSEKGPIVFRQHRVTKGGKEFVCLKFRSMVQDTMWQQKRGVSHEMLVTCIGGKIRPIHFDDWPQLWNVLKGDMSLVGVRPKMPEELKELSKKDRRWLERNSVKAGMTSLNRVLYYLPDKRRAILSWLKSAAFLEEANHGDWLPADLYYVKHCSFKLDLVIFYYTVLLVLAKLCQKIS